MSENDHATPTSVRRLRNPNRRMLLKRGLISASAVAFAVTAWPALVQAQGPGEGTVTEVRADQRTRTGQRPRDGQRAGDGERTGGGKRARDRGRPRNGERPADGERPRNGEPRQRGGARQR